MVGAKRRPPKRVKKRFLRRASEIPQAGAAKRLKRNIMLATWNVWLASACATAYLITVLELRINVILECQPFIGPSAS